MPPTVEVLPKSATASGANWTYTTLPPAQSVSGVAKIAGRGARNRHSNFENTAARQRQINSRILDLEKDNYRDPQIPVPKKEAGASRGELVLAQMLGMDGSRRITVSSRTKGSASQNVRRVLASQKTFVNHLADEEALNPSYRSRRATSDPDSDVEMEVEAFDDPESALDDAENGGLPLGYARAMSRPSRRPGRTFCEICGYWGMYRCGKCGARYCGLECSAVHQETRCQKFYA
jgi:zinc finger HIT domain-containing protein 1